MIKENGLTQELAENTSGCNFPTCLETHIFCVEELEVKCQCLSQLETVPKNVCVVVTLFFQLF